MAFSPLSHGAPSTGRHTWLPIYLQLLGSPIRTPSEVEPHELTNHNHSLWGVCGRQTAVPQPVTAQALPYPNTSQSSVPAQGSLLASDSGKEELAHSWPGPGCGRSGLHVRKNLGDARVWLSHALPMLQGCREALSGHLAPWTTIWTRKPARHSRGINNKKKLPNTCWAQAPGWVHYISFWHQPQEVATIFFTVEAGKQRFHVTRRALEFRERIRVTS